MAKFDFEIPEQKKKFPIELKESEIELLNSYARYLSHKSSKGGKVCEVKPDIVISGLIKSLSKDKDFKNFNSAPALTKKAAASQAADL